VFKLPDIIDRVNLDPAVAADKKPVTPRLVRFLIAEGAVDKPDGWKYGEGHAVQIIRYFELRALGLTVAQIAALRQGNELEQPVVIELAPGVVLHAARGVFGSAPAVAEVLMKLTAALSALSLPAPVGAPQTPPDSIHPSETRETTDAA
jgi:hypothetical protein